MHSDAEFTRRLDLFLPVLLLAFEIENVEQFVSKLLDKAERSEWEDCEKHKVPLMERTGKALLLSLFYNLSSGSPEIGTVVQRILFELINSISSLQRRQLMASLDLSGALPLGTSPTFWTDPRTTIAALKFSRDRSQAVDLPPPTGTTTDQFINHQITHHFVVMPFKTLTRTQLDEGLHALEDHFPANAAGDSAATAAASSASSDGPASK